MRYDFEWDPPKAEANQEKHGVRFEEGATVFQDPRALTLYDDEHQESEDRWITLGISKLGRLVVVCHTYRTETEASVRTRIFSCRRATKTELQKYKD
jgi:uncharacterized protein